MRRPLWQRLLTFMQRGAISLAAFSGAVIPPSALDVGEDGCPFCSWNL